MAKDYIRLITDYVTTSTELQVDNFKDVTTTTARFARYTEQLSALYMALRNPGFPEEHRRLIMPFIAEMTCFILERSEDFL